MKVRPQRYLRHCVSWFKRRNWWQLSLMGLVALFVVQFVWIGLWYQSQSQPGRELGYSFSKKYAQELGLNWQQAFTDMTEQLPMKHVRLMSYWDQHEPERNQYDFADLDWQMDQAAEQNIKVTLALGLRQPRWPECHPPGWYTKLGTKQQQYELLDYVGEVTRRYRDHPALEDYQLENEVANRHFGVCPDFDSELLAREYDTIKQLDSKHPIVINVSNQSGIPLRGQLGDQIGFSIYRHAHFRAFGIDVNWRFWYILPLWHSWRAGVVELLHDRETFVHELQTEPWGPNATVELTNEEQLTRMNAQELQRSVDFTESAGFDRIYLWGSEWWYWRATTQDDDSLWQAARNL